MASIKIHQDQENVPPELRQKQRNKNPMAAQPKRPVLTAINGNKTKNPPKAKQPLMVSAGQGCSNVRSNNQRNNSAAPVVPVAQFEAFKVYEDEDEHMARIDERLKRKCKNSVYKGTADDKLITKAELAERRRQELAEKEERELAEIERKRVLREQEEAEREAKCLKTPPTPMSLEKSFDESSVLARDVILAGNRKEIFFTVEEYRDDIYLYLKKRELRHRPKPGYISKQPDVTDSMRAILVDWLVEVAEEYSMHTETLYLAVNFIDRFLSYMSVVRAKLQLVGTAAMFIAAKFEEIFPPDVKEFVYITDDTYDKHQVIRMEHLILRVLSFDLSVPTPLAFISALCVSVDLTEKTMYLAMYLSELGLLEVEPFLMFLPSTIAASAIALARHTLYEEAWNDSLVKSSGYTLPELRNCIGFLCGLFIKAPTLSQHAIPDKYKAGKYLGVSKLEPNKAPIKFE